MTKKEHALMVKNVKRLLSIVENRGKCSANRKSACSTCYIIGCCNGCRYDDDFYYKARYNKDCRMSKEGMFDPYKNCLTYQRAVTKLKELPSHYILEVMI